MAWGRSWGEAQYEDRLGGSSSELGGLLQGLAHTCKVFTGKLSPSFVPAPASLLWNYPPALSCKTQPRVGRPHLRELFL